MYKIQVDHTDYPGCAQPHSGNEGTRRPAARIVCLEGREGGVLIFSNPSSNATIPARVAQIEIPFPFFYCFFNRAAEGGRGSRTAFGFLNRAAVGWAVSCSAFGFLNRAAVGWAVSCFAFGLFFFLTALPKAGAVLELPSVF